MRHIGVNMDANEGLTAGRWFKKQSFALNNVMPTYIAQFDKGLYYTSSTGPRSFPFSLVRNGAALMYNSSGQLVWNQHNIITRSSTAGAILGVVGSGGAFPTGWSASTAAGITHEVINIQKDYIDVRISGTNGGGSNIFPHIRFITANTPYGGVNSAPYTVSANIGIIGGSTSGFSTPGSLVFNWWNGTTYISQSGSTSAPTSVYRRVTTTQTMPASGVNNICPQFDIVVPPGATVDITLRVGQPQLEFAGPDTPKTYIETTGTAYYGPRFDHDPITLEKRGIMISRDRVNLISSSFNTPTLTGTTAGTGDLLSGFWTSSRITGDGVASAHFAASVTFTPGALEQRHCYAVVKAQSGAVRFQLTTTSSSSTTATYANFNPSTGALLANGADALNPVSFPMGDGFYYFGFDYVTTGAPAAGAGVVVGLIGTDTALRLAANTNTDVIDLTFMGNVSGYGPLLPIPTYNASVTRTADTVSEATGAWLNTTKGTLYIEGRSRAWYANSVMASIADTSGATDNILVRGGTAVDTEIKSASVVQTIAAAGASVSAGNFKVAYKYAAGAQTVVAGGSVGATAGTVAALPATQQAIHIGQRNATTDKLDGWIKELRYYADNSASNAQLQTLTT